MLDRFFDFIFSMPLIKKLRPFYKNHKEIVLYLFFGILTTLVSYVSYYVFDSVFKVHEIYSNIISWIFAVTFAFLTNRVWVFNSKTNGVKQYLKQMVSFYGGRVFSLLVETGIIAIFVTWQGFNSMVIKVLASFFVLVINYVISKLFVFKSNK